MRAIVQSGYGKPEQVLSLRQMEKPELGDDEVLVRVHAASVHPDVWHVLTGHPYFLRLMGSGLRTPKNPIPGTDMAGRVDTVGKNVTGFRAGDEVFGETVRGHQWKNGGAYAEFVAVRQEALRPKPANLTFEQASAIPTSGFIAVTNLGGRIEPGQKVLVNGAGGGVGMFAVQIAKSYGANVTGVDIGQKQDLVEAVGADQFFDYTTDDFTLNGERYDLIFDIPGNRSFSDLKRVLADDGRYVFIGHHQFGASGGRWVGAMGRFIRLFIMAPFGRRKSEQAAAAQSSTALDALVELAAAGSITPVIDRTFPLSEAVEALKHLAEGNAMGRVVISL